MLCIRLSSILRLSRVRLLGAIILKRVHTKVLIIINSDYEIIANINSAAYSFDVRSGTRRISGGKLFCVHRRVYRRLLLALVEVHVVDEVSDALTLVPPCEKLRMLRPKAKLLHVLCVQLAQLQRDVADAVPAEAHQRT